MSAIFEKWSAWSNDVSSLANSAVKNHYFYFSKEFLLESDFIPLGFALCLKGIFILCTFKSRNGEKDLWKFKQRSRINEIKIEIQRLLCLFSE